MISLLHDLARDHLAALVGFGQVFLASGVLVAFGYWLKARLLRRWGTAAARRPQPRRLARKVPATQARRRPIYFEPSRPAEPKADRVAAEPDEPEAPISLEAHSERIAAHVRQTIARGERALDLHNRALVRLESADYALQRLALELAHLISVPQKLEPAHPAVFVGPAPEHATRLAA